jgi:hypothetical protein
MTPSRTKDKVKNRPFFDEFGRFFSGFMDSDYICLGVVKTGGFLG